jgi:hypothetical protein
LKKISQEAINIIKTNPPFSICPQAYAELEEDTPGQIFGLTYKTDGKSSSTTEKNSTFSSSSAQSTKSMPPNEEQLSSKYTQGSEDFKDYSEKDMSGTFHWKQKQLDPKIYWVIGMSLVLIGYIWFANDYSERIVLEEQNKAIARNRERVKKKEGQGVFDDA